MSYIVRFLAKHLTPTPLFLRDILFDFTFFYIEYASSPL